MRCHHRSARVESIIAAKQAGAEEDQHGVERRVGEQQPDAEEKPDRNGPRQDVHPRRTVPAPNGGSKQRRKDGQEPVQPVYVHLVRLPAERPSASRPCVAIVHLAPDDTADATARPVTLGPSGGRTSPCASAGVHVSTSWRGGRRPGRTDSRWGLTRSYLGRERRRRQPA